MVDLRTCVLNNAWLSADERVRANGLVDEFDTMLGDMGVPATTLAVLRADDVIVSYLLVQRVEAGLCDRAEEEGDNAKTVAPPADRLVDLAGKVRERWRKAMKELDGHCAARGKPAASSLADMVKPMLKKADGVLEDALAFEQRNKGKRAKRKARASRS